MAHFFINRPIFAWVISFLIMLAGIMSITALAVSQYPAIAPPKVEISANYPGASAQVVEDSVTAVIEREMNGLQGLIYMSSTSYDGMSTITLTFNQNVVGDLAAVDVQNRLKVVESRLPDVVRKQGVNVSKASDAFLAIVSLSAEDKRHTAVDIGEYASSNVLPVLRRVDGVGKVMFFGSENAMRIWPYTDKMTALKVTAADISQAVSSYNARIIVGPIGQQGADEQASISVTVLSDDSLASVEDFENIPLRINADGSALRLKDVARIELGGSDYGYRSRLNNKPSIGMAVQLANGANSLATTERVKDTMRELSELFPDGMSYQIPYDTSAFVSVSIQKVVQTLVEAVLLVVAIMFLFMQNARATLIPTIVVPVALLGTLGAMLALGFSINMLTMFGMVLAIGILVDDAIIVVENVERIMEEEGLPPYPATIKAMKQISGAIVGITMVLIAVFIPMAFMKGAAGNIYRQFAMSLSVSIAISAFLALSLTPALCANFLRPLKIKNHEKNGFFGWFNRMFTKNTNKYNNVVEKMIKKPFRWLVVYGMIIAVTAFFYVRLPSSFLPSEDQGMFMGMVMLPPGATLRETEEVLAEVKKYMLENEPVTYAYGVAGFGFYGQGPNNGMLFVSLEDWSKRGKGEGVDDIVGRINQRFGGHPKALMVMAMNIPALPELGAIGGFDFRMQDRGGIGTAAMAKIRDEMIIKANHNPSLAQVRFAGMPDSPRIKMSLDREKANALGVPVEEINSTLGVLFGSSYVGDFILRGQVRRVIIQADPSQRLKPDDITGANVRNTSGGMVTLDSIIKLDWGSGPAQLTRYNGFPSFTINGMAAPGKSSGDAIKAMEEFGNEFGNGIGYAWSGQTYEELLAGNQTTMLFGLSILVVFLSLAALYESWSIPFSVMLVVPFGVLGAALGVTMRFLPNDIYFQVGLIAIIGLSARNAILIVEVAKDLWLDGMDIYAATLEATRLRLRPIAMTALTFGFGVVPLAFSTGAGSGAQIAIGTGVLGGIISSTVLSIFLVPVFFVIMGNFVTKRQSKSNSATLTGRAGFKDME